jgi:hypothetical protein
MKIFKIPVEWAMYGICEIEANNLDEAIEIFNQKQDELPLPEGDYIDGSFKGNFDEEDMEVIKLINE